MILDLGTGDGRAVVAVASAHPDALVIGLDASADAMRVVSGRASRRGPANTLFVASGVEALPRSPLVAVADLVTIRFPWGSLLRGVLGLDAAALAGIAAVVAPGGCVDVLVSVIPSDGVDGMSVLTDAAAPATADAWSRAGLVLTDMVPAGPEVVAGSGSSWARRLLSGGGTGTARPVWRLSGGRLADARTRGLSDRR